MSNTDKMYSYEADYKEQHAKHIKRPALVAIKKPLLSIDEMEDILTRLLVLYVPPTQLSVNFKGIRRGVGRKAFLMDWVRTSVTTTAGTEGYVPNAVYEVKGNENVYLSTNILATYGQSKDPLTADQILDLDKISSKINTKTIGCKLITIGDNGYVCNVDKNSNTDTKTFVDNNSNSDNGDEDKKKLSFSPAAIPVINKFSLYLLSNIDHEYLNPDKERTTQLKELVEHPELFAETVDGNRNARLLPTYTGKPVVIWDPTKPNATAINGADGTEPILDKVAVKKAYGYIPKHKIYAYRWDFTVPFDVKVNILKNNQMELDASESSKNQFLDKQLSILKTKLTAIYDTLYQFTKVDDYPRRDLQKLYKYIDCCKQLGYWLKLDSNSLYVDKNNTLVSQKSTYGTQLCEFIKSNKELINYYNYYSNSDTNSKDENIDAKAFAVSAGAQGVPLSFYKNKKSSGDIMWEACQEYLDAVNGVFKYNENSVAMLMRGDKYKQRIKKELNEAAANAIKENFTTSTAYKKDLTFTDFKIKYYSVLLKKVLEKYNTLKPFIDEKLVSISFEKDLEQIQKDISEKADKLLTDKETKLRFIKQAERVLFSPISGFYITSYAEGLSETKAPIWNSLADYSNFNAKIYGTDLGPDYTYSLLDSQNKDISKIIIDRIVSGISTAHITIKNNKEKYNYTRGDILNRGKFIIEPMDEVIIFLPTIKFDKTGGIFNYAGKLEQVFAGIIASVSEDNSGGYHSISIAAECSKKLMKINRTNMKPSATRDENKNNPLTPFIVPEQFYKSIENWMPLMFVQSLTYLRCMLQKTTEENYDTLLVNVRKAPVEREQTFYSIKKVSHEIDSTETVDVPMYYTVTKTTRDLNTYSLQSFTEKITKDEYDNALRNKQGTSRINGDFVIDYGGFTTASYKTVTKQQTRTVKKKVENLSNYTYTRRATVGYYDQVKFSDPLCEYLWYKKCSKFMPDEERKCIENSLQQVFKDYVYTSVIGSEKKEKPMRGTAPLDSILKSGNRAAYLIYKQRYSGILSGDSETNDKLLVARIIGTSQPAYRLQTDDLTLQFSSWKTNNDIINEHADRFNFIYYTDRDGIINFAPYNFDLTTLNTSNFTKETVDTDKMLVTRSSRDIETDDNPQILKTQYMINYDKHINDKDIVNWVQVSGNWVITSSTDSMTKALVTDPVLIKKFGYRAAKQISILGIQNQDALRLYGLSWMDRQNKQYISADVEYMFDSRMDVNLPYYVPSDETMYYCEGIRISYEPGYTCTCSLNLKYGRTPLMQIEKYAKTSISSPVDYLTDTNKKLSGSHRLYTDTYVDGYTFNTKLQELFLKDNAIKPFTYTQYKKLFSNDDILTSSATIENKLTLYNTAQLANEISSSNQDTITRNAAICCYNGYLWDNVAGISFEELVYNYAWLYAGRNTTGIITAIGSSGKFNESLITKYFTTTKDINVSIEEQNAINAFFIDVPAINDTKRLPEIFVAKDEKFTDLAVGKIVNIDWQTDTSQPNR